MIRSIQSSEISESGSLSIRVDEAALIVIDKDANKLVCAIVGDEADIRREKSKYGDETRYDVTFIPAENEKSLADYDGPVYSPAFSTDWDNTMKDALAATDKMSAEIAERMIRLRPEGCDDERGCVQAIYAFAQIDGLINPEVNIFNGRPSLFARDMIAPLDAFSLSFNVNDGMLPFRTVWKEFRRQKSAIVAIGDYPIPHSNKIVRAQAFYAHGSEHQLLEDGGILLTVNAATICGENYVIGAPSEAEAQQVLNEMAQKALQKYKELPGKRK